LFALLGWDGFADAIPPSVFAILTGLGGGHMMDEYLWFAGMKNDVAGGRYVLDLKYNVQIH